MGTTGDPGGVMRIFRITAVLEATSFLMLLIATYVKHGHDEPVGVEILGPIHGALFLAYVAIALFVASREAWTARRRGRAVRRLCRRPLAQAPGTARDGLAGLRRIDRAPEERLERQPGSAMLQRSDPQGGLAGLAGGDRRRDVDRCQA